MDMNTKVMVKSASNATVVMNVPSLNFRRVWEKKGATKPIPFEILAQAIYDEGVEKLFKGGWLIIDDMNVKYELGLEFEGEQEQLIVLDDNQKKRLLTIAPLHDLKEMCSKIPQQQVVELAYYAIENKIGNFDKAEFIKKLTGIDIIKAIELNKANEEQ